MAHLTEWSLDIIATNAALNVSVRRRSSSSSSCLAAFYHTFEQAAYLLVLHKSLYLVGSSLACPIEVCASRTQTLKTDYCVTNVWNVIITRCACRLYLRRRIFAVSHRCMLSQQSSVSCHQRESERPPVSAIWQGKAGRTNTTATFYFYFLEGIAPARNSAAWHTAAKIVKYSY